MRAAGCSRWPARPCPGKSSRNIACAGRQNTPTQRTMAGGTAAADGLFVFVFVFRFGLFVRVFFVLPLFVLFFNRSIGLFLSPVGVTVRASFFYLVLLHPLDICASRCSATTTEMHTKCIAEAYSVQGVPMTAPPPLGQQITVDSTLLLG